MKSIKGNKTKTRTEAVPDVASNRSPTNANTNTVIGVGVLVLSGLLDPCGDIGTQCRFDLLPIPWDKAVFAAKVSHAIRVELSEKSRIQQQAEWYTEGDESDIEAQARGIGVRAWIVKADADMGSTAIMELLRFGWSESRWKKAAREIDRLSFHKPPIDYPWPHETPDDEAAVNGFESVLLSRFENCLQAN